MPGSMTERLVKLHGQPDCGLGELLFHDGLGRRDIGGRNIGVVGMAQHLPTDLVGHARRDPITLGRPWPADSLPSRRRTLGAASGREISGWQPYDAWAHPAAGKNDAYLSDDGVRIRTNHANSQESLSADDGLNEIWRILSTPRNVVRQSSTAPATTSQVAPSRPKQGKGLAPAYQSPSVP